MIVFPAATPEDNVALTLVSVDVLLFCPMLVGVPILASALFAATRNATVRSSDSRIIRLELLINVCFGFR